MDAETKRRKHADYMREYYRTSDKYRGYRAKKNAERRADPQFVLANRARAKRWKDENSAKAKISAHRWYEATKQLVGRKTSEKHHNWKGDNASYVAMHRWIVSHRGRPSVCEHCGTLTAKKYEWANIDHRYERKLDQYIRLCTSCHRKYDYANGLCEKGGPRPKS